VPFKSITRQPLREPTWWSGVWRAVSLTESPESLSHPSDGEEENAGAVIQQNVPPA